MTEWSTPTEPITVKGIDLSTADYVYVTFSDSTRTIKVTKDNPTITVDGDDSIVTVTLSQQETGQFIHCAPISYQINAMFGSTRIPSIIGTIPCLENLLPEVLPRV